MSYDLGLKDQVTKAWCLLNAPHHMRGGTYCVGGEPHAMMNCTYNYAKILHKALNPHTKREEGIRGLYGMTGAESLPVLSAAIATLGNDTDDDYWKATEGNVKQALHMCLALAQMRPDGVWDGD